MERAERKAEADRLAKIEADKIEAERVRVENEKLKAENEKLAREKHEADLVAKARQAQIDAHNAFMAEQEKKKAEEEKAKKAEERKAKRAPDKAKLIQFSDDILKLVFPEVKSEEAEEILMNAGNMIGKLAKYVRDNANNL